MKKFYFIGALMATSLSYGQTNVGITGNVDGVYINEFHYDNVGTDVNEFVEVAGPAGTDLSAYTITLYNGNAGGNALYTPTTTLSGTIDDEGTGFGAVVFLISGIQNGAPDAIALSKTGSTDVQFLSYEGSITAAATAGGAAGVIPVSIGSAIEDGLNPAGGSLEYDNASQTWLATTDDTPGILTQGPLSVQENNISGLRVYPNPAKNVLNITSDSNEVKQVAIYNVLGKLVLSTKATNAPVNVSSLSSGVYVVKVTEEGKTASRRLVIE